MAVFVTFVVTAASGPIGQVARVVARESITIPGTTTRKVQSGETVIVHNAAAAAVAVAWGSSPDAAATAETSATTAGIPVPPNLDSAPLVPPAGVTLNVKTLS